jgi:Fe-S-cluster containining protein
MASNQQNEMKQAFINDGYLLAGELSKESTKEEVIAKIRQLYHQIDLLTDSFMEYSQRNGRAMDCRMGCSWCCHQSVFASTHEVLVIEEYLATHFSKEVIEGIKVAATAKAGRTKTLSNTDLLKAQGACPLLKNGVCMVYPVRPMACRIYLSSDVNTCIDKYNRPGHKDAKPALFAFMMDAGQHMNYGFVSALLEKQLISNEAPLEWLLHQFLSDKDNFEKWLNGKELNQAFEFNQKTD